MVTIPTIDQISGTTVMNKMRSLINNYIEFGGEIANTVNYMEEVIRNLPQDVTDVYNKETVDGMFSDAYTYIDTNFYKKTEVYTKAEVNNLVETVGSFRVVVVDELPEMGQEGIIYLIQRTSSTENDYDEYIWVSQWELIGQISNIDLDNYYTKTESDAKYAEKSNTYTKSEIDAMFDRKYTPVDMADAISFIRSHLCFVTIESLNWPTEDYHQIGFMSLKSSGGPCYGIYRRNTTEGDLKILPFRYVTHTSGYIEFVGNKYPGTSINDEEYFRVINVAIVNIYY